MAHYPLTTWSPLGHHLMTIWWSPHLATIITCLKPCKPYIFWKLLTATSHCHDFRLVVVTTWWPPSDHLVTTWWPPGVDLVTTWWPLGYHLVTPWSPLGDHLVTIWWLHGDHMVTTWWPFYHLGITWWQPESPSSIDSNMINAKSATFTFSCLHYSLQRTLSKGCYWWVYSPPPTLCFVLLLFIDQSWTNSLHHTPYGRKSPTSRRERWALIDWGKLEIHQDFALDGAVISGQGATARSKGSCQHKTELRNVTDTADKSV